MDQLFYCVTWVTGVCILWFFTDTIFHYAKLFKIAENLMLEYAAYLNKTRPEKNFFPDFLFTKALNAERALNKFILKMLSCLFCTTFWLAVFAALVVGNLLLVAPVYVISLIILLKIKTWI
jgi:hypothetical protein